MKRRIDNLVAAIEQGILTPATKARMEELEQQREALEPASCRSRSRSRPSRGSRFCSGSISSATATRRISPFRKRSSIALSTPSICSMTVSW